MVEVEYWIRASGEILLEVRAILTQSQSPLEMETGAVSTGYCMFYIAPVPISEQNFLVGKICRPSVGGGL